MKPISRPYGVQSVQRSDRRNRSFPRFFLAGFLAWLGCTARLSAAVSFASLPAGSVQPEVAVDGSGRIHSIWLSGEARSADVFYQRRNPDGTTSGEPVRVNHQPGSAIAIGTVRGARIAVGDGGEVHVIWVGSTSIEPKLPTGAPLLYSRLLPGSSGFEVERNLMTHTRDLDGGAAIAVEGKNRLYVFWHAGEVGKKTDEATRRVYMSRSLNGGESFAAEGSIDDGEGACGCCGMAAVASVDGGVVAFYRTARQVKFRAMTMLRSRDHGDHFEAAPLQLWETASCPMTTSRYLPAGDGFRGVWETEGSVFGRIAIDPWPGSGTPRKISSGRGAKHPAMAMNRAGETLVVWTEGTGWQRGGTLHWQEFDAAGKPKGEPGSRAGVPVWSYAACYARADGEFVILQ